MNKEHIGKLLKTCREEKGLKQDYVACKLGISKKAYSKIETGVNGLQVDYIPVLCDTLGIPYFKLLSECLDMQLFPDNDNYSLEKEILLDYGNGRVAFTENEFGLYQFMCKVFGVEFPNAYVLHGVVELTNAKRRQFSQRVLDKKKGGM